MGLGETTRRLIRKLAVILHSRNLKTPLTLQYTYLLPYIAPFPSYEHSSAFRTHFAHFSVVFSSFLQPTGRSCDAISGRFVGPLFLDKPVKFHDPSLNRSREIPPVDVGGGIFDSFPPLTSDRK